MGSSTLLVDLPQELLLKIAFILEDVNDVYNLRQTCKHIANITRDNSLWTQLLLSQLHTLPLPVEWRANPSAILLEDDVEHIAAANFAIAHRWPRAREGPARRLKPSRMAESILLLDVFDDRWLVCVYVEGVITVWDLGPPYARKVDTVFCGVIQLPEDFSWSCVAAAADHSSNRITLALTKTGGPTITRVVSFNPREMSETRIPYEVLAFVSHPLPMFVRAVDPANQTVIFSHACFIELYQWTTNTAATISTQTEELDELWNGILGLQMYDEYIICVKARSLEVHYIPRLRDHHAWLTSAPAPARPSRVHRPSPSPDADIGLVHHFPTTSFRGYSLSRPQHTSSGAARFVLLGSDVLRGLSVYVVELQTTDDSAVLPLVLDVRCIGEHSMAAGPSLGEGSSSSSSSYAGNAARGFISACCLGIEGKRGLWIERTRGSMRRAVTVFALDDTDNDVKHSERDLKGHIVHEDTSYDLRDDLNHCAISEVSGTIVLGTRQGELQILRV